jgi:hypothetical protein
VYQVAAGYVDGNDATTLRHDPLLKACCTGELGADAALASQPTFSRLENSITRSDLYRIADVLADAYVASYTKRPKEIILDLDTTDDPTHGAQQLAFFNGYYDTHMYHPLLFSDGHRGTLITAVLRPGNAGNGTGALSVLKRLVQKIRTRWKGMPIIVRADAGFAMPGLYEYCESEGIFYIIGFYGTEPLRTLNQSHLDRAQRRYQRTHQKVRHLSSTFYQARSWSKRRRILMKAEVTSQGDNQRFVITNLPGRALALYDFYAARGQMENQVIKEFKLDLQADRLSCHRFLANQFRLLVHAIAYHLLHALRQHLHGTDLASARMERLRSTVLKIGARVHTTVRRMWVEFASGYPFQDVLHTLFTRLCTTPSSA